MLVTLLNKKITYFSRCGRVDKSHFSRYIAIIRVLYGRRDGSKRI